MIEFNRAQLGQAAKQYGFVRDTFEKVLRLKEVLIYLNTQPYGNNYICVKNFTKVTIKCKKFL